MPFPTAPFEMLRTAVGPRTAALVLTGRTVGPEEALATGTRRRDVRRPSTCSTGRSIKRSQLARIPSSTFAHTRAQLRGDARRRIEAARRGRSRHPRALAIGGDPRAPCAATSTSSQRDERPRDARLRRDRRGPRRARPARLRPGRASTPRRARPATRRARRPTCSATSATACARGARRRHLGAAAAPTSPARARSTASSSSPAGRSWPRTLAGAGGGRSLLLNGHIDVVTPRPGRPLDERPVARRDPRRQPLRPRHVRHEGRHRQHGVRGRDARAARRAGWAATSSSARTPTRSRPAPGGIACVQHGVRADAGICTEPTGFEVWTCSRGSLTPVVTVEGRPGPRRAGAAALARGRRGERDREAAASCSTRSRGCARSGARARRHAAPVPVADHDHADHRARAASGSSRTRPAARSPRCSTTCRATPTPTAGARRRGRVRALDRRCRPGRPVAAGASAARPVDDRHPAVRGAAGPPHHRRRCWTRRRPSASDVGVGGLDSWFDAATYTRFGGTPMVGFGPRHIDERPLDRRVRPGRRPGACAQAIAIAAIRWCGVAN